MSKRILVELTEGDVYWLYTSRKELEQWQFENRGKARLTDSQKEVEESLKFINRLIAQLP